MIGAVFQFGNEIIEIRIDRGNCLFRTSTQRTFFVPIENLRLSDEGIIKEFPDLKENPERKRIAIQRFKEKIKSFNTEDEAMEYIINDLKKMGYVLKGTQKAGHRAKRIN